MHCLTVVTQLFVTSVQSVPWSRTALLRSLELLGLNQCWWNARQHTCSCQSTQTASAAECVCVCASAIYAYGCAGLWQNQIKHDTLPLTHCPSFLCSKSFNPQWGPSSWTHPGGCPVELWHTMDGGWGAIWLPPSDWGLTPPVPVPVCKGVFTCQI